MKLRGAGVLGRSAGFGTLGGRRRRGVTSAPLAPPPVGQHFALPQDGNFNALGGLTRLTDGRYLAVYRKGTGHTGNKGAIYGVLSEDGETWGAEFLVYSDATWDARDPCAMVTTSGALLVSTFLYDWSTQVARPDSVTVLRASDPADPTQPWTAIPAHSAFTGWEAASGPIVEPVAGTLLLPVYGQDTGGGVDLARIVRSTDGGDTWADFALLSDLSAVPLHSDEPNLVALDDGRLLALIRTGSEVYRSYSSDGGATWDAPVPAYAGIGAPRVIQAANGGLVTAYRSNTLDNPGYRTSPDRGLTWTDEALLWEDPSATSFQYGQFARLFGSYVALAYWQKLSGTEALGTFTFLSVPGLGAAFAPSVSIDQGASGTLTAGQTLQLSASTNGYPAPSVSWASSDEGAATVDEEGLVQGIAAGSTTITAEADNAAGSAQAPFSLTVQAPSGSGLLDQFAGAAVAHSTARRLRDGVTSALRVQRDSDSTEQDIGFDASGDLDEAALLAFVGSGSGYITTLYDQSTNARHLTQVTRAAMPRIVNAGAVERDDWGRPTARLLGAQWMSSAAYTLAQPNHRFALVRWGDTGQVGKRPAGGRTNENANGLYTPTTTQLRLYSGASLIYTAAASLLGVGHLVETLLNGAASRVRVDADTAITGDAGATAPAGLTLGAGNNGGLNAIAGTLTEWIEYPSDQSANADAIRANLADYYGVTV